MPRQAVYSPAVQRLVLTTALLAGCSYTPPTPVAYVTHGPARQQRVTPLAALPATCDGMTMGCQPGYLFSVASATRMSLELGGLGLVDSEIINAELRRRHTSTQASEGSVQTTTTVTGATWMDLDPVARRTFLSELGIHGVLRATVGLGVPHGMAGQRTVTVTVQVTRLADDALVWQSECHVETGDFHSESQAVELATQCALESGTLW